MTLPHISDDILLEIFTYVSRARYGRRFLCKNATLSRRTYPIFQSLLFRKIDLYKALHDEQRPFIVCELVERSLREKPALGRLVQELSIHLGGHGPEHQIGFILMQLTNLRAISFGAWFGHEWWMHFWTDILLHNSLTSLRSIRIGDSSFTASDILRCIVNLPRLEELTIALHLTLLEDPISETLQKSKGCSGLVRLDLRETFVSEGAIRCILQRTRRLERLTCCIPRHSTRGAVWPTRLMLETYSSRRLLETLDPVKQTLTDRTLYHKYQVWPGHDGTLLDLSAFTRLGSVAAPRYCFLVEKTPGKARSGVHHLLPPSLKSLNASLHVASPMREFD